MKIILGLLGVALALPAGAQTPAAFFDDTIMQDVYLQMTPADWAALQANYLTDNYYNATFTWNSFTLAIGIRSHGNGSRSPIKPNFDLKFDKYVKKQTFLGESLIIAKANNEDASNLHEKLSFDLFRRMGLPAPRESFARVHLNGQIFGFYVMVEHLDEQFLTRDFGESTGYLYEWTPASIYNFEDLGTDPNIYLPFLDLKTSQAAPDLNNFAALVDAINLSPDATFVANLSKYLDPKLYLTHVAAEMVLAEADGMVGGDEGMNNFYLYQFDGQTLYQMIVWDKDLTFAYAYRGLYSGASQNALASRLLAIPEYALYYQAALLKIANLFGGPGGWADQEFNRLYTMIAPYARNDDPNKQCNASGVLYSCGAQQFEDEATNVRTFIAERQPWVVSTVGSIAAIPNVPQVTGARLASSSVTTLAPGALVTITGTNLGATAAATAGSSLPRTLSGTWAAFDGIRAPLLATSAGTLQVQIPWDIYPEQSSIAVAVNGALSDPLMVSTTLSSPVIVAVTHASGDVVTASNPAAPGEALVAYATGLGDLNGVLGVGAVTPASPLYQAEYTPQVTLGGVTVPPSFAGLTPGFAGLYQINFSVPANAPAGSATQFTVSAFSQAASATVAVN